MKHTCGQKPNDEGRILPQCSACRQTAYGDGQTFAFTDTADSLLDSLTQMVKDEFNPLAHNSKDLAEADWKTGHRVITLIEKLRQQHKAEGIRRTTRHFEETHVEPEAPPDSEKQPQQTS